jgi:hypothetical protein
MSRKIANFLARFLRYRDIWKTVDGVETLYLRRFFLTPRSWPIRIFLHFIARSDDDRHLHDHPWSFASLIFKGEYHEETKIENVTHEILYSAPSFRIMKAEHAHKIHLSSPVWSLIFAGKARRQWGFYTDDGWINWRQYLGLPEDLPDQPEDVCKN